MDKPPHEQLQQCKRPWSETIDAPRRNKRSRGLLSALESISLHDDVDDDGRPAMEDDDEFETSSYSPISLVEEFDDDDEEEEEEYDEELLSDEELMKRRLEHQVFHKLALGNDERDPTERRIAQIILQYMEQAAVAPGDTARNEGDFCSLAMDLD